MKKFRCLALLLTALAVAPALGIDKTEEMKLLQGKWILVEIESDGRKLTNVDQLHCAMTISGDNFVMKQGLQEIVGTLRVDPNKKPKEIDADGRDAQGTAQKSLGIYELDKETLRICFSLEGKARPKEMKTTKDSETMLEVFRRAK